MVIREGNGDKLACGVGVGAGVTTLVAGKLLAATGAMGRAVGGGGGSGVQAKNTRANSGAGRIALDATRDRRRDPFSLHRTTRDA
jgi:hypothetical protein